MQHHEVHPKAVLMGPGSCRYKHRPGPEAFLLPRGAGAGQASVLHVHVRRAGRTQGWTGCSGGSLGWIRQDCWGLCCRFHFCRNQRLDSNRESAANCVFGGGGLPMTKMCAVDTGVSLRTPASVGDLRTTTQRNWLEKWHESIKIQHLSFASIWEEIKAKQPLPKSPSATVNSDQEGGLRGSQGLPAGAREGARGVRAGGTQPFSGPLGSPRAVVLINAPSHFTDFFFPS